MATAYAVAASNWLKTAAASNLFGYMVVKEYWRGLGEGVTIFHPGADLSNQVFLKGDAEYCFAATLYAISYNTLNKALRRPLPYDWYKKWCEAPDGLAFAETSPSREAYIGLKELLLSNDFICRQAIDKFAESVAYLPWN